MSTYTQRGGTMTTEGFIPYEKRDGILCPVALAIRNEGLKAIVGPHAPLRGPDGALRFVLPGGGVTV